MPNTETAGHTPTGWTVGEDDEFGGTIFVPIEMPNGMKACEVYGSGDDCEILAEDRERAALICQAVNAFGPLREALGEARSFVVAWKAEYEPQARSFYGGHQLKVVNAMLSKIDAALKAARGEA